MAEFSSLRNYSLGKRPATSSAINHTKMNNLLVICINIMRIAVTA